MITALPAHPVYGEYDLPEGLETVAVDLPVGTLTAYRALPTGPSRGIVLVVPGYTGSKEDHRMLLPLLAEAGWSAVAISRRGQADSTSPEGIERYTLGCEAGDIVAVAKLLARRTPLSVRGQDTPARGTVERVHLVGHSLGGVIARAAALADPDVFASVTLLCSGPRGWRNRKLLERRLAATEGNHAIWLATNPHLQGLSDAELSVDERFVRDRMDDTSPESIIGGAFILEKERDLTEELAGTGLPILVAHGAGDAAWPIRWQKDMAERAGARYEVIADSFHSPQLENPRATADVLSRFWSTVARAAKAA